METTDLRTTVKGYVNTADTKLLKMIKALAESYLENEQGFSLTEEDYHNMDNRREAHLSGKSKSFSWEEVKQNARNAAG